MTGDNHGRGQRFGTANERLERFGDLREGSNVDKCTDHYEKAGKEHERAPFHIASKLLRLQAAAVQLLQLAAVAV